MKKKLRLKRNVFEHLIAIMVISLAMICVWGISIWATDWRHDLEPVYTVPQANPEDVTDIDEPDMSIELITYQERDLPLKSGGEFKTYMDWRKITNVLSDQYALQRLAVTDDQGFRRYQNRYLIAVGSYYSTTIGTEFRITLSSGKVFHAIVGDLKKDIHTDPNNQYIPINGNIIEFIVDTKVLRPEIKRAGDISKEGFIGKIIKIEEVIYEPKN